MSEEQVRIVCENAGSSLLQYQEAVRAVVRLRDRRKIAINVRRDLAEIRQTRGFYDLLFETPVVGSWDLIPLYEEAPGDCRLSETVIQAAVLDALVERLVCCNSLSDVTRRSVTNALDPFDIVSGRLDALAGSGPKDQAPVCRKKARAL